MKVRMLPKGNVVTVNDSYGARLIEQGKAVLTDASEDATEKAAAAEHTETPAELPSEPSKPVKDTKKR